MMSYLNACDQARNQLGIPEGAKSFPTGAQIFWTMSNICKLCPTHFSRGAKNFLGGFAPLRPPCLRVCLWHHSCQFKLKKISVVFLTCTCAPTLKKVPSPVVFTVWIRVSINLISSLTNASTIKPVKRQSCCGCGQKHNWHECGLIVCAG